MTRTRLVALATAALLSGLLPLAQAHGDEHNDNASPPQPVANAPPQSYWSLSDHVPLIYWHIGLELLAWLVVLPLGVMLSIARSRLAVPVQFVFLALNAFALLLGLVYNHRTPELYENNAHSKIGWIITCIATAWLFMALIQIFVARTNPMLPRKDQSCQPLNVANMARYERAHEAEPRWSNDSGQGTERNSSSLYANSASPSVESEDQQFNMPSRRSTHDDLDHVDNDAEKTGLLNNNAAERFLKRNLARFVVGKPLKYFRLLYVVIDRTILLQGFVAIMSGTVVYGGIGHGGAVFNVLAHFVKGGIFLAYGLLTLGRWMGTFADFGWAWNVKPPKEVVGRRRAAIPSAEFVESFVIWLYGCTNVFLEHLAAWGDEWTPQDLEHVSISVMFFGGGLLGMIVESSKMRELLNSTVLSVQPPSQCHEESWQSPRQYRFSMNPMPGLVILLLGKMMSSHHQDSMLSTMIHSQWGTMFMGFALSRTLTYITLYIRPPVSYLPSRPLTELIAAFCLIAGGITFMVSNKDTVAAMESYDLDAMFTFTVTMGLVLLLMAWTVVLVAIKGWATRRESATRFAKQNADALA